MDSVHIAIAEVLFTMLRDDPQNALITYGDLADQIGNVITARNTAGYLGDLSSWAHEEGAPLLSALVVNSKEYMPGNGFFDLYRELTEEKVVDKDYVFRRELKKVREYKKWDEFSNNLGINYIF